MTADKVRDLVNNKVFDVDKVAGLQYKFTPENTLTIGGMNIPPTKVHYEFTESDGKVYLKTNHPLITDELTVNVIRESKPIIIELFNEIKNQNFATIRTRQ